MSSDAVLSATFTGLYYLSNDSFTETEFPEKTSPVLNFFIKVLLLLDSFPLASTADIFIIILKNINIL